MQRGMKGDRSDGENAALVNVVVEKGTLEELTT
jgi:hypothetical protein